MAKASSLSRPVISSRPSQSSFRTRLSSWCSVSMGNCPWQVCEWPTFITCCGSSRSSVGCTTTADSLGTVVPLSGARVVPDAHPAAGIGIDERLGGRLRGAVRPGRLAIAPVPVPAEQGDDDPRDDDGEDDPLDDMHDNRLSPARWPWPAS